MLKKIRGEHIPYGPFKLGRYGIATNLLAVTYLLDALPDDAATHGKQHELRRSALGAVIGALVDWTISGHKRFKVPVMISDSSWQHDL